MSLLTTHKVGKVNKVWLVSKVIQKWRSVSSFNWFYNESSQSNERINSKFYNMRRKVNVSVLFVCLIILLWFHCYIYRPPRLPLCLIYCLFSVRVESVGRVSFPPFLFYPSIFTISPICFSLSYSLLLLLSLFLLLQLLHPFSFTHFSFCPLSPFSHSLFTSPFILSPPSRFFLPVLLLPFLFTSFPFSLLLLFPTFLSLNVLLLSCMNSTFIRILLFLQRKPMYVIFLPRLPIDIN